MLLRFSSLLVSSPLLPSGSLLQPRGPGQVTLGSLKELLAELSLDTAALCCYSDLQGLRLRAPSAVLEGCSASFAFFPELLSLLFYFFAEQAPGTC